MYFASSVAVAVAPGTPGIGNVTTGLPDSHDTDVSFTFATPSANSVPGLAPRWKTSRLFLPTRPWRAPCGLAQRRTSRSCTAAAIGVAFPFGCTDLRTGRVLVPGVQPADHFDVRVLLSVRSRAGVLDPLTEGLVVRARTKSRQRARLPLDLDGALALVFERGDHVAFVMALQHAHAPHPVEEHGLQVFGVLCGCVGLSRRRPGGSLRTGRQRARRSRGRPRARPLANESFDQDSMVVLSFLPTQLAAGGAIVAGSQCSSALPLTNRQVSNHVV